jgi:two-component system CheB/CheR fusion protein
MATKNKTTRALNAPAHDAEPFVVGVGASAGGLDALERFFGSVPAQSGLAFVVLQHQEPTHPSALPTLLGRVTTMPVEAIVEGARIEADHVWVAPPGKDVSLLHGAFELFDPPAKAAPPLPIDFFFRALAEDRGDACAAIVLSGMGSDGSRGIEAIDEAGGIVLVQEPSTAAFDAMPRSALQTGLASCVAAPDELARALPRLTERRPASAAAVEHANELEKIAVLLRARTGNDFSFYKRNVLSRRVERRIAVHQLANVTEYLRLLRENTQEQDLLFKELLIGVTRFFRDPDAWTQLEERVVPKLLAAREPGRPLRAWCVGCSTGEEAYSLAIVLREALARADPSRPGLVRVFATDLDRDAIERARRGVYPEQIASDVSEARLCRWFVRDESGGYRVGREIREAVTFAPHNLLSDPPFTRLELITCRNLLIYLEPEAQKRLFPLFHYCLEPGGTLFLGSAETLGAHTELFTPLDRKWRLFEKKGGTPRMRAASTSFTATTTTVGFADEPLEPFSYARSAQNLQGAIERLLIDRFCPAAVLVTGEGDILYLSGQTGRYLEPPAGRANWNLFAMAREGLREELSRAFRKVARRGSGTASAKGLSVRGLAGRVVDVAVHTVEEPEVVRGLIIVAFQDSPAARAAGKTPAKPLTRGAEARRAELEVRRLQRDLQALREDMQASNEELRSANEELQSSNEELQSSNEELTTSTEEMLSLNEELQTVNAELQSKIDELSRANNDMKNLLDATDIATLFLDAQLCVRRFTPRAARLFKLLPGDLGRPVTDIATSLVLPSLGDDVAEVLRTLVTCEREVRTLDDRWFAARTMPYRTFENLIDGVVMTFVEITNAKRLEGELAVRRPPTQTLR